MIGWVILAAVVVIILLLIGMYNSLVRLKVTCDNAWADIDVQLKRRYDLIPNLVETVKGYAAHEKGTLEAVINARNRAMTATSPGEKAQAENMLSGALKSLFALSEAYPQLRAIESSLHCRIRFPRSKIRSKTPAATTTPWCVTSTPKSSNSPPISLPTCWVSSPVNSSRSALPRSAKLPR
jgi:LemA family